MVFTIMQHYSNPYLKTLRKKQFESHQWIDLVIIIVMMFSLSGWARIVGYNAGFKDAGEIYLQLPPSAHIASSTPQILPKTTLLKETPGTIFTLHKIGIASYYDYRLDGEKIGNEWSKSHDTCATKGWNRYGKVRVTNLDNAKSVICYVNDNGPRDCEYRYKYKLDKPGECIERDIDLSSHAFKQIADTKLGLINVMIEEVQEFSTFNK